MSLTPLDSPVPDPVPLPGKPVAGRTNYRGRPRSASAPTTMRVTAEHPGGYSVTVGGPDLDLHRALTLTTDMAAKIRKALNQKMSFATFISLMRDQAALAQGERTEG